MGIKRKRERFWMALMLSGFFLRSLIPIGFMPMVGADHSVRLVVCDSYAPTPWTKTLMPTGMAHGGHEGHGGMADPAPHPSAEHPGAGPLVHHTSGLCPYGSGPALGALPSLVLTPVIVQRPPELAVLLSQAGYFKLSPRAQSPRGPPA
jgi:hypothetical protein